MIYLKNLVIYFFSNIAMALVPILLMPVITQYLTPEDYGLFTTYSILLLFASNFVRFELNTALKLEYVKRPSSFSSYLSTAFIFSFALTILLCMVFWLYSSLEIEKVFDAKWLFIIAFLAFFRAQIMNLHHLWQVTNNASLYSIWGIFSVIATYSLLVFGLIYFEPSWEIRAYSELLVGVLSFFIALILLVRVYGLKMEGDFDHFKDLFVYSLPLLPTTFLAYFFMVSDRLFIKEYTDMHSLGLYSIALQLATIVDLAFKAILPNWESWIYNRMGKITLYKAKKLLVVVVIFSLLGSFLLILSSPIIEYLLPWLVSEEFLAANDFIVFCMLVVFFAGIYRITKVPLVYIGKTKVVLYINVVMLLISISLMCAFVPKYGVNGASGALVLTYLSGVLMQLFLIFKSSEIEVK